MPELPEVESLRRSLEPHLVGRCIQTVTVRQPLLRRPLPAGFAAALRRRTIRGLSRKGKHLCIHLEGGATWIVHLGMTGTLQVDGRRGRPDPHEHVSVTLSGGQHLRYRDPRRFGSMSVCAGPGMPDATGLDPLDGELTAAALWRLTRGRRRRIKDLLMDQRLIAGLGNIYALEALHRAGIRPGRRAFRLRRREAEALARVTRAVLQEALDHGGSTISDYRDAAGQRGRFQERFRVYDREGKPCFRCRTSIRRVVAGGRSSYYCPTCQT